MSFIYLVWLETWRLLLDSALFVLFGLVISGLLHMFISPQIVARHLGQGRVWPVVKAALFGIPIPLCSCGVLPAAAGLKKQGANNGAVTAFLISTPESGIDSISITYALLDPLMTIFRPLTAFVTAIAAGITENSFNGSHAALPTQTAYPCPIDGCCDGINCPPNAHRNHHGMWEKIAAGLRHAFREAWADLVGWFWFGMLLAGIIAAAVPDDLVARFLGGGMSSMLLMLAVGIPIYICATASTPIAAAMILKGVSPGAALVFLIAGPATNIASLTVLVGVLGKRAVVIYLAAIACFAVLFGLLLDKIYALSGISAQAVMGQTVEMIPHGIQVSAALLLIALSAKPLWRVARNRLKPAPG